MCGVVGWFQRDGRTVETAVLRSMTEALRHRGPDGGAIWHDRMVGLGHRRLAIRDLSDLGRQPLSDPADRIFISYNGEIYNDAEIRRDLARAFGVRFRSTCDAETIPHAFLAWGDRAFERLEGMFAIALWERDAKTLHLARDGIGIKPLFYADTGDAVLFASEAKALFCHPALGPKLDPAGLHAFLATGHAGPDGSIYAGVRQVPPGTVLSFGADSKPARARCFWRPTRRPAPIAMDEAVDALRTRLSDVVASQVVSDVPVGLLQSGGIDSTIVTLSAASRERHMPVFTAAFEDRSYDETASAARIAAIAGCPHHIVRTERCPDFEALFRAAAYHVDGQCADTGLLAYYQLAAAVRERTKVVLGGDGGDEFFAGYDTYAATRLAARLDVRWLRSTFQEAGWLLYRAFPRDERRLPRTALLARFLLGLGADDAPAHLQWRRLVMRPMLPSLYGPAMVGVATESPYGAYRAAFDDHEGSLLDKALVADQRYHLQSVLAKVDSMSMAHGLEVRVPLLDRRIMDFAGMLPVDLLAPPGGPGKLVLRRLAERLGAPKAVTMDRKKGFNVPIAALMRHELAPFGDRLMDKEADVLAPFLNPDTVRRWWREHRAARANHAFALWPLLLLATYLADGGKRHSVSPALDTSLAATA
ncbi:MAG: asparagine synthase (glutamine-hydrolyzing) [Gemmatimonas sp.]